MSRVAERLYLIVDGEADLAPLLAGLPRGAVLVQVRAKSVSARELWRRCVAARLACRAAGARVVVNDRADVALAAELDGVHLPEDGMGASEARALLGPEGIVGASTHSVERALERAREGADLVTIGPVWETPDKIAVGPTIVRAAATALAGAGLGTRLFALGGITTPDRAKGVTAAGAWGVACFRAASEARALLAALGERTS